MPTLMLQQPQLLVDIPIFGFLEIFPYAHEINLKKPPPKKKNEKALSQYDCQK